jgi:hypothetical protein
MLMRLPRHNLRANAVADRQKTRQHGREGRQRRPIDRVEVDRLAARNWPRPLEARRTAFAFVSPRAIERGLFFGSRPVAACHRRGVLFSLRALFKEGIDGFRSYDPPTEDF